MLPVTSAPICQASDAHDGVVAANRGTIPTSAGVRSPLRWLEWLTGFEPATFTLAR